MNWKRSYDRVMKDATTTITSAPDPKHHACKSLMDANRIRQLGGESQVFIFEDFDSCKFLMKVGLEFVEMKFCPFCGRKLC